MAGHTLLWVSLGLFSAFTGALIPILAKIGLNGFDARLVTTVWAVLTALFLLSITFIFDNVAIVKSFDTRTWIYIGLSALCGAFSWRAYFSALQWGPASKVVAIDRLSLVFVILMATFIGEPLTVRSIIGAITMITGAFLIVW